MLLPQAREERDVHSSESFLESVACKASLGVRVECVWTSVVTPECLCRHFSRDISEPFGTRSLSVQLDHGCSASVVDENSTEDSQIFRRVHPFELIAGEV